MGGGQVSVKKNVLVFAPKNGQIPTINQIAGTIVGARTRFRWL